jgi:hypothetical protein
VGALEQWDGEPSPAVVDSRDKTHLIRVGRPNLLERGIRTQNVPVGRAPSQQVVKQRLKREDGPVQGVLN